MKNFIKKYFSFVFVILFFFVFSYFYSGEYIDFHSKEHKQQEEEQAVIKNINNFSLSQIRDLEKTEFYYTPSKALLDILLEKINKAKSRVYLEVYMLTEKRIQSALIKAKARGLDIKVILERNPYLATNINNKAFDLLEKSGVEIVWANPQEFSFVHAKFMLLDDEIMISTGNLTYSSFAYNRDFYLFFKDKLLLTSMEKIFLDDFNYIKNYSYDINLVLSPVYSRKKFEIMLEESTKTITMYFQYLKDKKLVDLLIKKSKENIYINIVLSEDSSKNDKDILQKLENAGVKIKFIKKPKIHAKAILIDDRYLFIGSENFSDTSLDENREIGIILKDKDVIGKFKLAFEKDFGK